MKTTEEKALEIARLIADGKGIDAAVICVSEISSWTDYFVIATVTSATQSGGLQKQIKDYVHDNEMEIHVPNRKIPDGADWTLVDIGCVVVHLMSKDAREFYELEKLWHSGKRLM
jgi:ribosome-associated protein